jgi:alpha-glucosidase (family GH31 glycosyl hydrolase)
MSTLRFTIPADEHWWGGRVCDGLHLPFGATSTFHVDLNDNGSNQVSPFFVSNRGRFLWNDAPFVLHAENGEVLCEGSTEFQFFEGHENLRGAFLAARQKYFPAPQTIPAPLLFRAPQYNTWIELMYDQEESAILNNAQRLLEEGYPPGVLMIDDNWQEDYGVWEFHPGRFRDAKAMIERLHDWGFEIMLWICPFVSPDCMTFRQLRDEGAFVLADDGKPHLSHWWNGFSAVLDLTQAIGRDWFAQRLQYLTETYGVDGFKFDAGDLPFYPRDAHLHSEAFNRLGAGFPLNEFRAAWKSADLPLAQRLADRTHSWGTDGLASLIPNQIAQGLFGYPFVCPDMIGGGEYSSFLGESFIVDAELVVRYAQAAALCPMMQFSVAPWRILDERYARLCREAAQLHLKLGEEILQLAEQCALSGEPMLRSLEYQFPGQEYSAINDQFLLGDSILVAPVLQKGQVEREVVIPSGVWCDDEGQEYAGPQTVTMQAPLERLIWMRRVTQ